MKGRGTILSHHNLVQAWLVRGLFYEHNPPRSEREATRESHLNMKTYDMHLPLVLTLSFYKTDTVNY